MTAVDRPDNRQDEGDTPQFVWLPSEPEPSEPGALLRLALASARAGAGEQQREQVARWLADFECRSHGWSPDDDATWAQQRRFWLADADELLALLDRTQPDGEPDPGPQCPSTSHDTDGGWRCEHRAGHDGGHRNGKEEW